jgi:tetratricopeptide (TPR) repeat protein
VNAEPNLIKSLGSWAGSSGVHDVVAANPLVVTIAVGVFAIMIVDLFLGAPWWVVEATRWATRGLRASRAKRIALTMRQEVGPRFAVMMAPFRHDRQGVLNDVVKRALNNHAKAFLFDREILVEEPPIDLRGAGDGDAAREWVRRFDADLLIWGDGGRGRVNRIYFVTSKSAAEGEPVQEIRIAPPEHSDTDDRLAAGIAYIFARTALPTALEADRYRIEKLAPVLDALGALAHEPPAGLGAAFEQVLRQDAAAIALSIGRRRKDADELRRASRLRVRILAEIDRAKHPVEWATARADLGRVHLALGQLENDDKRLSAAAEAFAEAVEGLKGDAQRAQRGRALLDLGNTCHERAKLGVSPAARYAEAAKAYRGALKSAPDGDNAFLDDARRGLATSLHALSGIDGDQGALRQAIEAFRDARTDRLRAIDPLAWAETCHRLGEALSTLAVAQADPTLHQEAVSAFEDALKERPRDAQPKAWAETWAQLGAALLALGKGKPDLEALQRSVEAFRNAMKEITLETEAERWAQLQNSLGNAHQALGEATGERRHLVSAVTAYRTSIEHIDRRRLPYEWAGVQNNLGNALHVLGERSQGVEALEAALTAHRNALSVRTKESSRVDWAATRNNMGLVLTTLGARLRDPHRLEEAVGAYRDAVGVFRMAGEVRYAVMAERNLDKAKILLEESRRMAAE